MKACTRCERVHQDAETAAGRRLSCTDVKQFWKGVRERHERRFGHTAEVSTGKDGQWVCVRCNRVLPLSEVRECE
ncbi:MAG: hypothetical protein HY900_30065 [Deltaproteobacteria bacterium]|nr:hypothetical protein [Deltaproteobacteria bacterium]